MECRAKIRNGFKKGEIAAFKRTRILHNPTTHAGRAWIRPMCALQLCSRMGLESMSVVIVSISASRKKGVIHDVSGYRRPCWPDRRHPLCGNGFRRICGRPQLHSSFSEKLRKERVTPVIAGASDTRSMEDLSPK